MNVVHKFRDKNLHIRNSDNPQFMMKNKIGGFLFFGSEKNISKYNGFYIPRKTDDGWTLYKTIESIRLSKAEPNSLVQCYDHIERTHISMPAIERFHLFDEGMVYETKNFAGFIEISMDAREIHDFSPIGRIYEVYTKGDMLIVNYVKYSDAALSNTSYKIYLAIAGVSHFERVNRWENYTYTYDQTRKSSPEQLYIFNALRIGAEKITRLFISADFSEEGAIAKASSLKCGFDDLTYSKQSSLNMIRSVPEKDQKILFAYYSSQIAMRDFLVDVEGSKGIYAGLPWFYQFWTRDEAISIRSLMLLGKHLEAKQILMSRIDKILDDGRIPNRYPHSDLGSADGVGWVFTRIHDLITLSEERGELNKLFSRNDLIVIRERLSLSIERLEGNYKGDGLFFNRDKETWMDTEWDNDTRSGYRIEIQALMLSMYRLMQKLCNLAGEKMQNAFSKKERELSENVRKHFFNGESLSDGDKDSTVRPNIFLAYYIYPHLLGPKEWEKVFDHSLKRLWCSWGGIASIDEHSPLFCPYYTGQDNRSYHRGDSWFFMNNIAAISMLKLNRKKYNEFISRIKNASSTEIVSKGIISEHSEISSASELRSEGCMAQAWSSATFVELVEEMYNSHDID